MKQLIFITPLLITLTFTAKAQTEFLLPSGVNGEVYVVKKDASGNLYIGGDFSSVNGIVCKFIAKFDGTNWTALGSGMNGPVYDITFLGSDLYAGGNFTTAGGVSTNYISKWDGSSWSALGSGINGAVYSLTVIGTDLYAGGNFSTAGGVTVRMVGKWNGASWSALGSGSNVGADHWVFALANDGTNLYIGGYFTTVANGAVAANRVAKWNGTNWSALGGGLDNTVNSMAVDASNNLYVGGVFANRIQKWNGTSWSAMGTAANSYIYSVATDGTNVYAQGGFTTIGGVSANYVAKWNGSTWSALSTGLNSSGTNYHNLYHDGTDLYIGGSFITAGGNVINRLAKWNGLSFSKVGTDAVSGNGLNGSVKAVIRIGSDLYVGGAISQAGTATGFGVYKWDGTSWSRVGVTFNSSVYDLAVDAGGTLYAAGNFTDVGGDANADYIVKWDGSAWVKLHNSPPNQYIEYLTVSGNNVYAAGWFSSIGGISASRFAYWNGTSWVSMSNGAPSMGGGTILCLEKDDNGNIYLGGSFNGTAGKYSLVRWDGTTWNGYSPAPPATVYAIAAVNPNKIYVGSSSPLVSKWNGSAWSTFGNTSLGGYCASIVADNTGHVIIGGTFTNVYVNGTSGATTIVNRLAQYSSASSTWSAAAGSGIATGTVNTIYIDNTNLICGGSFHMVGTTVVSNLAIIQGTVLPVSWHSFTAQLQNKEVLLQWSTIQEEKSLDFFVQHSNDGTNWKPVDSVPAIGYSNDLRYYNYIHKEPVAGLNYYRIIQRDIDGRTNNSEVRKVIIKSNNQPFTVVSNLVTDGQVRLQVNQPGGIPVSLYSYNGKLLWQATLPYGINYTDISKYAKGIYLIQTYGYTEKVVSQ